VDATSYDQYRERLYLVNSRLDPLSYPSSEKIMSIRIRAKTNDRNVTNRKEGGPWHIDC
jgi:hypothetical protein